MDTPYVYRIVDMTEVSELTKNTKNYGDKSERVQGDVLVRSPRRRRLTRVLTGMGATVLAEPGGGWRSPACTHCGSRC